MTALGEFLNRKAINKAEVARKTGISKSRLSQLSVNESTKLTVEELYKIAQAMELNPCEVLDEVCKEFEDKS